MVHRDEQDVPSGARRDQAARGSAGRWSGRTGRWPPRPAVRASPAAASAVAVRSCVRRAKPAPGGSMCLPDLGPGGRRAGSAAPRGGPPGRPARPAARPRSSQPASSQGQRACGRRRRPRSSRSRNHSRCCAKDSASSCVRGGAVGSAAARRGRAGVSRATKAASVGAANSAASGTSTPEHLRGSREASRMASSEWPPRAKKSSCRPMRSSPAARPRGRRACSPTRRPARTWARAPNAAPSGAGSARRSSLPLGVSGSAAQPHVGRGHHVLGQLRRRPVAQPRRRPAPRPADARRPPAAGRRRRPRAPARPPRAPRDARAAAASISPSSMRKPRILTWWSLRPRNSSVAVRQASAQVAGAVHAARPARRTDRARSARRSAPAGSGSRGPRPRRRCGSRRPPRPAPARRRASSM